ncbi:MAG: hypothetical protein ABH856_00480 [Patescibacteria group bacterium]|nr:hypothetical protein [Patescibacteria group bacterium]
MVNVLARRKFEEADLTRRWSEQLRNIFATPLAVNAQLDQITGDVRPRVRQILEDTHGPGQAAADQMRDNEERTRRFNRLRRGNFFFDTQADVDTTTNISTQLSYWMNAQNLTNAINAPRFDDIRHLLERRLGADVLQTLEDHPEIRFGIALALTQGANPPAILAFLQVAVGDQAGAEYYTDADDQSLRDANAKADLEAFKNISSNILNGALEELFAGVTGNIDTHWQTIDDDITTTRALINGINSGNPPAGVILPANPATLLTPSNNRLKQRETEMNALQTKKRKLQVECTKILDAVNRLVAAGAPVPPGGAIATIQGGLGGVTWTGGTIGSWTTIQTCVDFLRTTPTPRGAMTFTDAINELRPHLQRTVDHRANENRRAGVRLTTEKAGLGDKINSTTFLYKVWFEIYRRQAIPAGGGNPTVDRGELRRRATFAAMMSVAESRDQQLLQIKNELRCEELARRSNLWRRLTSRHNFSPSANSVLARIKHVSISKDGKEAKPFARLNFKKLTSRAEVRKAVQNGDIAKEDVPRLALYLESVLTNYKKHTIKPKDAMYLVDIIQSLRAIRTEQLHGELMTQFRNVEGTDSANMVNLLDQKLKAERAWELQMREGIEGGEFLNAISRRAIRKDRRAALKEVRGKMANGEWGYKDAVSYLEEKGFSPGILKKSHLVGRKMKNWMKPRKKEEGKDGLAKRAVKGTAKGVWTVAKQPFRPFLWAGKKLGKLGLGLFEVATAPVMIPAKGLYRKLFRGNNQGKLSRLRDKTRWFSEPGGAPAAA